MIKKTMVAFITLAFIISACASAAPTEEMMEKEDEMMETPGADMMADPTEAMMEDKSDDMMGTPEADMMSDPTEAMMEDKSDDMMGTPGAGMVEEPMMDPPAWFQSSLTDVNSGDTYSIQDFEGKVVLVETMAVWCPTCKSQQEELMALHAALGMDTDLVTISLDIDPNENADDLKAYTQSTGFDWIYAVAPVEVSREISQLYGDQFLNPPSTPILIIDRKGEVHLMPFGIKSSEDLKAFIEPFLQAGM